MMLLSKTRTHHYYVDFTQNFPHPLSIYILLGVQKRKNYQIRRKALYRHGRIIIANNVCKIGPLTMKRINYKIPISRKPWRRKRGLPSTQRIPQSHKLCLNHKLQDEMFNLRLPSSYDFWVKGIVGSSPDDSANLAEQPPLSRNLSCLYTISFINISN